MWGRGPPAPHGDEGVLHHLIDEAGIGAAAGEAQHEPGSVPLVEHPQRSPVAVVHGAEQLRVGAVVDDRGLHTLPVARP
jgi:hypothetical protein